MAIRGTNTVPEGLQKLGSDVAKLMMLPDAAPMMESLVELQAHIVAIAQKPVTPGEPGAGPPGAMAPPPAAGMMPTPMESGGMPPGPPGVTGPNGLPVGGPPLTSPDELRRALAGPASR